MKIIIAHDYIYLNLPDIRKKIYERQRFIPFRELYFNRKEKSILYDKEYYVYINKLLNIYATYPIGLILFLLFLPYLFSQESRENYYNFLNVFFSLKNIDLAEVEMINDYVYQNIYFRYILKLYHKFLPDSSLAEVEKTFFPNPDFIKIEDIDLGVTNISEEFLDLFLHHFYVEPTIIHLSDVFKYIFQIKEELKDVL